MANPKMSQQWGEYMSLLANKDSLLVLIPILVQMHLLNQMKSTIQFHEDGPNDVDINIWPKTLHKVNCNPSYGIKHVIQTVKDHTRYDIPYQKAWYSLKMAREIIYDTWESSVQKLPKYMGALKKYNPGTIVEWEHKTFKPSTGAHVIGYIFWAFAPCIEGFQFCRNIISVDGTHLYTKYRHKMLIAAAMDGNQQVLPLAFAIVDDESTSSWK
ncbi:UNVERIFIED_CONTAM: hypothetical protein Sradi_7190500 [Sesamum radiatum]|uniref:MULE transposase domain-containing protein n=1 Tax=Sesamum radiatum TaxID=300843 RepID=A0AAW2IQJ7_SESRA